MTRSIMLRLVLPCAIGVAGALAVIPQSASAATGCELNACRSSQGNCDLTDMHVSCKETSGGCETTGCFPD